MLCACMSGIKKNCVYIFVSSVFYNLLFNCCCIRKFQAIKRKKKPAAEIIFQKQNEKKQQQQRERKVHENLWEKFLSRIEFNCIVEQHIK